jgi:hypothetical protein
MQVSAVTLYKGKVGFFERQVVVDGTQQVVVTFDKAEIDRVCKSLRVSDENGGIVSSVSNSLSHIYFSLSFSFLCLLLGCKPKLHFQNMVRFFGLQNQITYDAFDEVRELRGNAFNNKAYSSLPDLLRSLAGSSAHIALEKVSFHIRFNLVGQTSLSDPSYVHYALVNCSFII